MGVDWLWFGIGVAFGAAGVYILSVLNIIRYK